MPAELQALALLTIFFTLAWVPVSIGKGQNFGLKWLKGNRESTPGEVAPWVGRCERAYNNLKDYFPAFAVAILLLSVLGKFDDSTRCAAWIFVAMRIAHYVSYGAGVFFPRFLTFFAGLIANLYLLIKVLT